MSKEKSQQEDLSLIHMPKEVLVKHFPLHYKNVLSMNLTCKQFSFFRTKSEGMTEKKGDAYLLMDTVHQFNYKKAQDIAKRNPASILEKICYVSHEDEVSLDSIIPMVSPLQQSFYNLDSYIWNIFYQIVKDDPVYLESYKVQLSEMNEHFDIQPLHDSYDEYISKCPKSFDPESMETQACLIRTRKIREEQDWLPKHFIFEMARPCLMQDSEQIFEALKGMGYSLDKKWLWDKKKSQTDGNCFNMSENFASPDRLVLVFEQDSGLGYTNPHNFLAEAEKECGLEVGSSMLVRGDCILGARPEMAVSGSMLKLDLDNILSLYHQRQKEFNDHRELLLDHTQTLSC